MLRCSNVRSARPEPRITHTYIKLAPTCPAEGGIGAVINLASLNTPYFRPALMRSGAPVLLHGCRQHAVRYAADSGWLTLVQRHGFALLLLGRVGGDNPMANSAGSIRQPWRRRVARRRPLRPWSAWRSRSMALIQGGFLLVACRCRRHGGGIAGGRAWGIRRGQHHRGPAFRGCWLGQLSNARRARPQADWRPRMG